MSQSEKVGKSMVFGDQKNESAIAKSQPKSITLRD